MLMALRHLLSIALLPFTVAVLIPLWLVRRNGVPIAWASEGQLLIQLAGCVVLGIGLRLFVASLRRFAGEGRGTLAPWDPPRNLVVEGPYRYVRNPMISGLLFVLFGEALILRSLPHLEWAAVFLVINLLYIPLFEEPQLARRFGADYDEYRRNVPGLLPRFKPWTREDAN